MCCFVKLVWCKLAKILTNLVDKLILVRWKSYHTWSVVGWVWINLSNHWLTTKPISNLIGWLNATFRHYKLHVHDKIPFSTPPLETKHCGYTFYLYRWVLLHSCSIYRPNSWLSAARQPPRHSVSTLIPFDHSIL